LCGVRGVVGGKLYLLNYGRIIAGHVDPIEKKPVIHYRPGSKIFSIATSGCSWLCRYCFSPETSVLTDQGIRTMEQLFDQSDHGDEVGYPTSGIRALTHEGKFRSIQKVFRHSYEGQLLSFRPFYLPEFRCTPNHEIFVYDESQKAVKKKRADQLTTKDMLVIPKSRDSMVSTSIDSLQTLQAAVPLLKRQNSRPSSWTVRDRAGSVRFGGAKTLGIPRRIALNEDLAELLGIYCAEGSATLSKDRPNSWVVTFSFGSHETELINRTQSLLEKIFYVKVARVHQGSELRLAVHSAPLGVFLFSVAGATKYTKRVPVFLLHHASTKLLSRFVEGYFVGDGTMTGSGGHRWIGSTSVSRELTLGVWYMLLRLHMVPRFYVAKNESKHVIEGRVVKRSYDYQTRVLLSSKQTGGEDIAIGASKLKDTEDYILVPLRAISSENHQGPIFNMEVEGDHSYSASFVAVSNCQNFDISQRRKIEGVEMEPQGVVDLALENGCEGIAYTYNEPSIFIEYARDVGKLAHKKGIFNIFVSNGYDTPESVGVMGEFLDCLTVDFKGSGETGFVRKYIGIPDAEPIFQTLLDVKQRTKIHVEITDLIVPEVGDNLESARKLARWVYDNLGPDTPIHFLRFHPDYKMMDLPVTPVKTLERHLEIAKKEGLRYVYIGNVPGHPAENTYCPGCKALLIERTGYDIGTYSLDDNGRCRSCGYQTPIVGPLSKSAREYRFVPIIG
jgi:pyruvate formate lyase activating enzyme